MIYLDHNATTPVLPEVLEAMLPWLTTNWGNPSSIHRSGRQAKRAVEEAREKVARLVGAQPEQVVFTSGATEANNAALHSAVFRDPSKRHIVTSVVEHSAVLAYCDYLERVHRVEITRLPVDSEGMLDVNHLHAAIRADTALVSMMWANNETGVIWPIADYAAVCRSKGAPLHSDAVQVVGKLPVNLELSGASYLSLSGHKFGAPKGIGALVIETPDRFEPMIHGGKQERALRGGTESVPLIVALGNAAEWAEKAGSDRWNSISDLRNEFETKLTKEIPTAVINGGRTDRLPNTSNIHLPGMDGDALVTYLDQKGICVSSGSACLESAITPSHVILAMSGSYERASETLRISLGLESNASDLDRLGEALKTFASINA